MRIGCELIDVGVLCYLKERILIGLNDFSNHRFWLVNGVGFGSIIFKLGPIKSCFQMCGVEESELLFFDVDRI